MSEEEGEKKKGGGPGIVVVAIAAALVGAGSGAGSAFFVANRVAVQPAAELPEGEDGAAAAEDAAQDEAEDFQERLLPLEPIVANITGDGYTRLLKVKVDLLLDSTKVRGEAEARSPQLRDAILTIVSSKRLGDVAEFEGKALLKEELRDRINQLLETGAVESVLFSDFVVQ